MGQAVADVAHPPQYDIHADEAAEGADDYRRNEAVAEEFVLKGN
jgi:hypothetical protein